MICRKLLHIVVGSSIPVIMLFLPTQFALRFLLIGTLLFLSFEFLRIYLFSSWSQNFLFRLVSLKEGEFRELTGASYILISALLVFWLFDHQIAILSLLYLTLGDPVAALVGSYGSRFKVGRKSLLGSGAFILSSLIPAFVFLFLFDLRPVAVFLGLFIAALVELFPLPWDDNLTVPLASATAMWLAL